MDRRSDRIEIDKQDLIWIAGFFDGEGHIDIAIYKSSYTGGLIVNVSQNQAHSDVLYLFCYWGGRVFKGNKVGLYRWQSYAWEAQNFLQDILPYLKIKQRAAELAIQFQTTMHPRGKCKTLPPTTLAKRLELINEFRQIQLARRGGQKLK